MAQQNPNLDVEEILGYPFVTPDYLTRALHAAGNPNAAPDGNKPMAMVGDAVLRLVLLVDLTSTGASRGTITSETARIVSNQNLARICSHTGIVNYIKGNPSHYGEQAPRTKSATIEAILAAVFLDSSKDINTVRTVMASLGLGAPAATGTG